MEFTYAERRPTGALGRFVESVWYARGTIPYRRELIAPTGSCVAVVVLGAPIAAGPLAADGEPFVADRGYLIGPHDGPVVNEPTGETFALGIVTTPVGAGPAMGVEPARVRGRVVDLAAAWRPAGEVRRRLLAAGDPETMLELATTRLEDELRPALPGLDRCAGAVELLQADPSLEVGEVARRLGVSHEHLDREFVRHVGLTPRAFARIGRLRRVLADLDVFADVHWTRVATDAGWFDQSHFIRDFKRHTGTTPSAYLRAQRAEFTPDDAAPGFVPQR
jgi:AraC-like DNA-binding protein